jgi:hypothetical protein
MSRSNYSDELDPLELGRWRGAVLSAIRGKRGQRMLGELLSALSTMPVKELIADDLVTEDGKVCALGALGAKRKLDMTTVEPTDPEEVGALFDIPPALAAEIEYENDECGHPDETPAERWTRMRKWVRARLRPKRARP